MNENGLWFELVNRLLKMPNALAPRICTRVLLKSSRNQYRLPRFAMDIHIIIISMVIPTNKKKFKQIINDNSILLTWK